MKYEFSITKNPNPKKKPDPRYAEIRYGIHRPHVHHGLPGR